MSTLDGEPLPDPEAQWERAPALAFVDRAEVERRVGPTDGPLIVLDGGQANVNARIGDRVVRLYRRDASSAPREARLLTYGWRTFRVPKVLSTGDDFLVLEYVDKRPVLGTGEHGSAVGQALAEIHGVTFERAGWLDASLRVERPFPDLVIALVDYARSLLTPERCGLPAALCAEVTQALEAKAPALRTAAGPAVLLHGDFKPSNLHWTSRNELLVLDWEFAYAGSALSDIGQVLRWTPPEVFVNAFAENYSANGGQLVAEWRRWAATFDLVNLAGLLANTVQRGQDASLSPRVNDVQRRIEETLSTLG
ncbi:MAG TPA: aminoglycoside phosphotransferase family protein [Polyangiaceae bacterium]|jgi:aminoglycoside phosphotransferase (APT) family kinase protein|nr:aminoglycoside phosphotransferase family protein [Polyangiaceae bacterium]